MRDKKYIWVTGGAGYIGSNVCKLLAERTDYLPVSIDDLSAGHRELVKWGPLIEADITDMAALTKALSDWGKPEAVIHLAAKTSVEESMRRAPAYWRANAAGTLNVIEAMTACGCGRLVFSSTAAVYGSPALTRGIREDDPMAPVNVYGESKRACEEMIKSSAACCDFSYVIFRYFNVAGADPDGKTGRWREPGSETLLIPRLVEAARAGGIAEIYGTDYATRDGTAVRDYIHVSDIASAHIDALAYLTGGGESRTLNLGTGRGMTVLEIAEACEKALGITLKKKLMPRRAGDPESLTADPSKAGDILDWKASELSSPENLIRTADRWEISLRQK